MIDVGKIAISADISQITSLDKALTGLSATVSATQQSLPAVR